jgi:hypothetical protein
MARFARGHFEREFTRPGETFHISASADDRKTEFPGGASHELFIGITAAAAQLVIEMGDGDLPFIFFGKLVKDVEQNHRVHAAGDGNENFLAAAKKSAGTDGLVDLLGQIAHASMLMNRETGARGLAGGRRIDLNNAALRILMRFKKFCGHRRLAGAPRKRRRRKRGVVT